MWPAIFSIEVKQFFIVSYDKAFCVFYISSIYQAYQCITRALYYCCYYYYYIFSTFTQHQSYTVKGYLDFGFNCFCSICFLCFTVHSLCWLVRIIRDTMQWWSPENINTERLEKWEDFCYTSRCVNTIQQSEIIIIIIIFLLYYFAYIVIHILV